MELRIENLGLLDFERAASVQQERLAAVRDGLAPTTLLLLEHEPVITLGRGAKPENLLDPRGIPVVECERGGDATLHLPGQIVGYLIRKLPEGRRDLRAHLRLLESILIEALVELGIEASRREGSTGVWIDGVRKIASLGIACRQWVTYHGFALNVSCDLSAFEAIQPCGLPPGIMTSVERETGRPSGMAVALGAVSAASRRHLDPCPRDA